MNLHRGFVLGVARPRGPSSVEPRILREARLACGAISAQLASHVKNYPVLAIAWMDFSISPTFPLKILGGFPRKTTLQELLGTMGLEPTDSRGKMQSISHE